jgi:hypothetical protein
VQSGKKRRLALSVRRSGPAAAYDARSLCVTQRVQLTEVVTEPGLKFNSRKRQVIWARMLLYEEEWVINFCSFQAGTLNQVVGFGVMTKCLRAATSSFGWCARA